MTPNLFLNNMVSEDDRKTFDMHKSPVLLQDL
jgi:hypothetical protein